MLNDKDREDIYFIDMQNFFRSEVQPYPLRNTENFRLRESNTSTTHKFLFNKFFQVFNTLTKGIKIEKNYNVFQG